MFHQVVFIVSGYEIYLFMLCHEQMFVFTLIYILIFILDIHKPILHAFPSLIIEEGSPLVITCSGQSSLRLQYIWSKDNLNLTEISREYKFKNINRTATGNYSCTSYNKIGEQSSDVSLVEVKCKFMVLSLSKSVTIFSGNIGFLCCFTKQSMCER